MPAESRHAATAPGSAALCTLLPFVLLLALLAWAYPLTTRQHGRPRPAPTPTAAATAR
ncbi:hypothetical protein [Kitasatospora purpeofusca]|uniref:hypothetical protein n=1 Tax=Kitasatospora purpeofusca TaxID=67352 RepID=UPI0022508DEF|nr:hypothetical protein [Kitasatospora purpeofusca]MCX4758367.1 hypothetical protein [Kitasatospora purpeofusca]WSR31179.1 hypothetical protein OG715_09435 [Kitasatospora purpeofusca]